jgi:hypothetical protein
MPKAAEHLADLIRRLPKDHNSWRNLPCVEWDLGCFNDGYGAVVFEKKTRKAHRVAYKLFYGSYPSKFACHHCDNKRCINPHHLFDGDARANGRDASAKGRLPKGFEAPGHRYRKLDPGRVRDLLVFGYSRGAIARWLNVTQPYITKIANGKFRPIYAGT